MTSQQLSELEGAYNDGFEFNQGPEDPCNKLKLISYKKFKKWKNEFQKRGFTIEKIKEILHTGKRVSYTHPEKGTTMTQIFHPTDGTWIMVDFVDCVIWQIAPANFKF